MSYELPRYDRFGSQWTFRTQADLLGYNAQDVNPQSGFVSAAGSTNSGVDTSTITANIRAAIDWRLPLVRSAGSLGQ